MERVEDNSELLSSPSWLRVGVAGVVADAELLDRTHRPMAAIPASNEARRPEFVLLVVSFFFSLTVCISDDPSSMSSTGERYSESSPSLSSREGGGCIHACKLLLVLLKPLLPVIIAVPLPPLAAAMSSLMSCSLWLDCRANKRSVIMGLVAVIPAPAGVLLWGRYGGDGAAAAAANGVVGKCAVSTDSKGSVVLLLCSAARGGKPAVLLPVE